VQQGNRSVTVSQGNDGLTVSTGDHGKWDLPIGGDPNPMLIRAAFLVTERPLGLIRIADETAASIGGCP
jgi:hypothetical protein